MMFRLTYGILYLLSLLPLGVLYLIADLIFFLAYHVIGYRKKVVYHNLYVAFPDKTAQEREKIAREFYRNFADTIVETIKLISISEKELKRRFTADFDKLHDAVKKGKSIQVHLGHFFNWEFANLVFASQLRLPFLVVYMPLNNKTFERIMHKLRTRFGAHLLKATRFKEEFKAWSHNQYYLVLVGDQNPGRPDKAYWTSFFGKRTPFVMGPEKGAKRNDTFVFFSNFYKVKRGYYHAELELLTENPRSLPEGEITSRLIEYIEQNLRKRPSNYLWSHRRWKHQWNPAYSKLWVERTGEHDELGTVEGEAEIRV